VKPDARTSGRIALIEIGTNSVKLLIADSLHGRSYKQRHFSRITTRIGRRMTASGNIGRGALEETIAAMHQFQRIIARLRCDRIFAFSTYALRRARNAGAVIRRLEKQTASAIKVLSGKEEARFAYMSAAQALPLTKRHTVLFDVGGGSTEFALATEGTIRRVRSLPVGALHLTERFIRSDPPEVEELDRMMAAIEVSSRPVAAIMKKHRIEPLALDLVVSGGSITTLAKMIRNRTRHPAASVSSPPGAVKIVSGDVSRFLEYCTSLPLRWRRRIPGLEPDRADIIPAGLAIVRSLLRLARKRSLYTNWGGVREGVLLHIIQNDFRW
jgi:exopolyphosphatase/guanosine-5'-triphosphate,3'-diphosphate pyrophosphatase